MKILILGSTGILGKTLFFYLKSKKINFSCISRKKKNSLYLKNFRNISKLKKMINDENPTHLINCLGVTKFSNSYNLIKQTKFFNTQFPKKLAKFCFKKKIYFIHISTDCVFSGKKGNYSELDYRDADDVYGQSKIQGEILRENVLIIRKSTIGLELSNFHGLIEWFLSQKGNIKGFRGAIYSGLITAELSRVIKQVITDHRQIEGIYNVSSAPVSKYYLLKSLSNRLNLNNISIEPDDTFACDRSLNMEKLSLFTGYKAPSWDSMLDELAEEILKKY